ncbi:MAG: IS1595 family transposase [Desulfobacterales bacterium]
MGRIRLHFALDCSAYSLETFIIDNIEPGATIATDDWEGYHCIDKERYGHETKNQSKSTSFWNLYGVHLMTTLVKRLFRGTFHGRFEPKYLQNYLDEYAFRFNRRKSRNIGKKFMRIVHQAMKTPRIIWPAINWDLDPLSESFAATGVS